MAGKGADYQSNTNPYNNGAVVFYPDPNKWDSLHDAIVNLGAQKRARVAAADKYYQDAEKGINTAGIREQKDGAIINNAINETSKYWKENPNDKIGVNQKFREVQSLINRSKEEAAKEKRIADAIKSGVQPLARDMEKINAISLPINDPRRYNQNDEDITSNIDDLSIFSKPFTATQKKAVSDALLSKNKPDETPDYSRKITDIQTGKVLVPYSTQYSPEKLRQVGDDMGEIFNSDKSVQINYERALDDGDPTYLKQHNDIYQQVYHKDITTPKDLAIADSLLDAQNNTGTKYRAYTDQDAKYERQLALIAARGRETRKNKEFAATEDQLWIDPYINKLKEDSQGGKTYTYKYKDGKTVEEKEIPIDPVLAKVLTKDNVSPDKVYVTSDGKFRPVFYKRDKDGAPVQENGTYAVDEISSVPITHDQLKLALGGKVGVKQLNKEMNVNQGTQKKIPLPKGQARTVKQNGYTYTWNETSGTYE